MTDPRQMDLTAINTVRGLAIDCIEQARSGHPGLPLGAAPAAFLLWHRLLRFDPADPRWPDRDRFVLSAGHGSMLLYALLHLFGESLSLDDLRRFRQWESLTPGHPEASLTPGVEATTGPLGQGTAVAVGMAIAERRLAARFNRPGHPVVDHRTWALVSDGDLMEGLSAEAASLAGHLGLGRLNLVYDANDVSLDGPLSLCMSEDVAARYAACGWHVQRVDDGDTDLDDLERALGAARDEVDRPSLVITRTTIGFGSPNKAGRSASHGSPLGAEEAVLTKRALGLDAKALFRVPRQVREHCATAGERGRGEHRRWDAVLDGYREAHPELAEEFERCLAGRLPERWDADLPAWDTGESLATRQAGGEVVAALGGALPELLGGDADLSCSTKTAIPDGGAFDGRSGEGRNLHFGVREHAMGAIANGIAYHGGVRPFVATFLAFSDYMRTPMRLAALDRLPAIFVFTHDSIGVGEDGPTHQPVEQVAALRAIPELPVLRPGDANETAAAWRWAIASGGPAVIVLSRQSLPVLAGTRDLAAEGVARGAYVLADAAGANPDAIVIATGSELQLAMAARERLGGAESRIRVVSMPCQETFLAQDAPYRESVLPAGVTRRLVIEAGTPFGWHRFAGDGGRVIGVERFGASAPGPEVMRRFGLTVEAAVAALEELRRES